MKIGAYDGLDYQGLSVPVYSRGAFSQHGLSFRSIAVMANAKMTWDK